MRLNLSPASLKLAVDAAVSKWRHSSDSSDTNSERYFRKQFTKRKPTEKDFASWLGIWMIARSSPKKSRAKLRNALWRHCKQLKNFKADDTAGYRYVNDIADQLQRHHLGTGRPLSLVSKFAFALNPVAFIPFDSRVREALVRLGHPQLKSPYSYVVYMKCVNHEREHFRTLLAADRFISSHIDRCMRQFRCAKSERKLLEMRVMDKALMLVGGFKPKRMRDELDRLRNTVQC